uniref:SD04493p n=1 Tax=Drosophila melanogaster TaxID=7227 RepID=Q8T3T9_DROME|nr:SD04493p [Drosophila melanogaster]
MSSDDIESPAGVNHAIAADAKAITNIVPSALQLMEVLHVPHALHAVRSGVAHGRHVRVMDDDVGRGTLEVLHGLGQPGTPVGSGQQAGGGHTVAQIRLLHVLTIA